jgi:uncharacterized membrane protein YkvA (DUF1232 family)
VRRRRRRGRVDRVAAKLIPALPAVLGLLLRLLFDARVPRSSKWLVLGVALYIISPLDLIPDFLGILGFTDDVFLVALALRRLVLSSGDDVVASNWRGSEEGLEALRGSLDDLGEAVPSPVRRVLRAYTDRW